MPMTTQQTQTVIEHLESKMTQGCPLCGARSWEVNEEIGFQGILDPEYLQPVQGGMIPTVGVTCTNCFFTFQLPAMRLGLIEQ